MEEDTDNLFEEDFEEDGYISNDNMPFVRIELLGDDLDNDDDFEDKDLDDDDLDNDDLDDNSLDADDLDNNDLDDDSLDGDDIDELNELEGITWRGRYSSDDPLQEEDPWSIS